MAKYKLSSNQMTILNSILNNKSLANYKDSIVSSATIKETKLKIGENYYTKKEIQRFKIKSYLDRLDKSGRISLDTIFKKSKSLSRASFNSIKTYSEVRDTEQEVVNGKVSAISDKISKVDVKVTEEICKISSKLFTNFLVSYEKASGQKANTQKKIDILKIMAQVENGASKKMKEIFEAVYITEGGIHNDPNYGKRKEATERESLKSQVQKSLEKKEIEMEVSFSTNENYMDDAYRKNVINMKSYKHQTFEMNRKHLFEIELSPSEFKKREKELNEEREKLGSNNRDLADKKHYDEMTKNIRKIQRKIELLKEEAVLFGEKVDLSGISIGKIHSELEPADSYEPNKYNEIHIFNVSLSETDEIKIRWEDDHDDWGRIPKGYNLETSVKMKINPALVSAKLKSMVIVKLKESATIKTLIDRKKSYKKEIDAIRKGKTMRKAKVATK